jgi:hypothetical protein
MPVIRRVCGAGSGPSRVCSPVRWIIFVALLAGGCVIGDGAEGDFALRKTVTCPLADGGTAREVTPGTPQCNTTVGAVQRQCPATCPGLADAGCVAIPECLCDVVDVPSRDCD